MEELTRLQDRVPPFPTAEAFEIMREDAGRPTEEIFSSITPEPVAAASIGQVYRATLRDTGAEVAVKVLRPGTRPQVVLDLFILRAAAERLFDAFARENLGCPATLLVDEFAEKLLEELDFKQEALNLRDFRRNFADDPSVQIPGVYQNLSSGRVLIMDWQPGVRCTAPGAFESEEARRVFLQNGVESGLRQLLDFGLFHGDPHPGNVLALPSGDIAYVDFGNVAEISRANQESLIDAVVHVMNKDYDNLAACLCDLGFLESGSDVRPVAEGLAEVWGPGTLSAIASAGNFSFRGLTKEFNKLLFKYPIRVPERFSLVIRALLTQENICLTLDPSFNFLNAAFPYVARRLLTDPDPNLRMRLFKIIIVKGKFEWQRLRELVVMAEAGASGGIKLPMRVAVALVTDTTKMLATDGVARRALVSGLRAVPIREHVSQAASLGVGANARALVPAAA
jgi:predicted unusual protein kinase regulating ubiquinone biosynthesis (AarF/ABC1/UbiB family)